MRAARPKSHLNVRAGLIIGPHDPTERYTYWVRRVARGGEVLAPVGPDYPIQAIHAGDIAEWSLEMAAGQRSGTFNVTSAIYPLGELLEAAKRETGSDARFTYVSEEFLLPGWNWMPTGCSRRLDGNHPRDAAAVGLDAYADGGLDADERGGGSGSRPLQERNREFRKVLVVALPLTKRKTSKHPRDAGLGRLVTNDRTHAAGGSPEPNLIFVCAWPQIIEMPNIAKNGHMEAAPCWSTAWATFFVRANNWGIISGEI